MLSPKYLCSSPVETDRLKWPSKMNSKCWFFSISKSMSRLVTCFRSLNKMTLLVKTLLLREALRKAASPRPSMKGGLNSSKSYLKSLAARHPAFCPTDTLNSATLLPLMAHWSMQHFPCAGLIIARDPKKLKSTWVLIWTMGSHRKFTLQTARGLKGPLSIPSPPPAKPL